jgi:DNA segregation ATPase FtsK/SpoIIIE, S-DNA-T family
MAKSASSNSNSAPSFQAPRYQPRWLISSICLLFGLLLSVAFIDFSPEQSAMRGTNPVGRNLVGRFGAEVTWWSLHWIGISMWLLPLFLLWMAYVAVRNARRLAVTRIVAMIACLASFSALATLIESLTHDGRFSEGSQYFTAGLGGLLGKLFYSGMLEDSLGVFGSGLLLSMVYAIGLMFIFTRDIAGEFERFAVNFQHWREERAKLAAERAELKRQLKEERLRMKNATPPVPVGPPPAKKLSLSRNTTPPMPTEEPAPAEAAISNLESKEAAAAKANKAKIPAPAATPAPVRAPATAGKGTVSPFSDAAPLATATDTTSLAVNAAGRIELNIVKPEEPKKAVKATVPQSADANYQFPPLTLLREQAKPPAGNSEEEHRRNAENLLRILSEFGVDVTLGEIHVGPVITRYEVIPAAGVRVEKIAGLDKNIALGMRAQSVRILAPIPGKAAVGVEVPNQFPTPVGMRELLESEDWVGAKAELPIALGKDVSGKPLISDLAKMPHLLIAGATGSGKSVCINSIVASVLYSKSPKDVRLLMVDPKIVELKIFNTLPHMLIPVVTEPKKVPSALKWLLGEMEQRYQIFAKVGVRNIIGFNGRKRAAKPDLPPAEVQPTMSGIDPAMADEMEIPERLPYIVAIIDELADLMMVAPAEVETSIARLAQLARAAGIHLIIATQRPSVNVITGVIKANLPSRIAFQVASQVDSRTILDTKGADTLIGRGDMLFSPPGSSRLVRAQGAFVSDDEVQELVEFLKKNGPPQYAQEVQAQIDRDPEAEDDGDGADEDLGDDEDLLKEAIGVLKSTRRASTSMLQRRLRIGYNRAARLMEIMEDKGIVGPENGAQPREILADLDKL